MTTDRCGNITLYNCDCMEYMKTIPDKYYELAIIDAPYRDAIDNQPTKDMRRNGGMDRWSDKPTNAYFDELFRISKNQIIWGANNFDLPPYKGFIVWKKKTISENFTMSMCELAYISEGLGTISKCFECAPQRDNDNTFHPTSKPIKLYEWLLHHYAKEGDKIFDSHFGSLSIGIACHKLGFQLDACELDPDYYQQAKKRLLDFQQQQTLF
jgi:site-specific DNA-methyltransferase (adenine-specific)